MIGEILFPIKRPFLAMASGFGLEGVLLEESDGY